MSQGLPSSLSARLGVPVSKLVSNDFPERARIAVAYLFADLSEKRYLSKDDEIVLELNRIGRFTSVDLEGASDKEIINKVLFRLNKLPWHMVCLFLERVYAKHLRSVNGYENGCEMELTSITEVEDYFVHEVNQILDEDGIGFKFANGEFQRSGRPSTQRAIHQTGAVLADERLRIIKIHFIKAKQFYDQKPASDCENCVKESLCALEAAIEILTGKSAKDFEKVIKQISGNAPKQIPAPIAEAMIKLHGYRGSGVGVAHAAIKGNRVESTEAELVLSLVADYITYLVNLFPADDSIPF